MSDHDWQAIRTDYENGLSLREVAAKYGVAKSVIGDHKHKEQWEQPNRTENRTDSNVQGVINRDVNASVRVVEAIKYRQSGWTYDRIAQQCGYGNPASARNAIQHELERVIVQEVEEWRNDHISRLEKMHEEAWLLAMDKSYKGRLFAFDRLLQIEERQAKLLNLDMKPDDSINNNITVVRETPPRYLLSEVKS